MTSPDDLDLDGLNADERNADDFSPDPGQPLPVESDDEDNNHEPVLPEEPEPAPDTLNPHDGWPSSVYPSAPDAALVEAPSDSSVRDWFRLDTARAIIFIAMFILVLFVIVDIIAVSKQIEPTILQSSFEAFKLIAMTAIGYLFGSQSSRTDK